MNIENVQNFIYENIFAVAVGGGAVFLIILAWLILRRVRLWYWRTSERADAILEIDKRLASMDENLKMLTYCGGGKIRQTQYGVTNEAAKTTVAVPKEDCKKTVSEDKPVSDEKSLIRAEEEKKCEEYNDGNDKEKSDTDSHQPDESADGEELTDKAEAAEKSQSHEETLCYTSRDCGRAKDGRVYTLEEIENCIKD